MNDAFRTFAGILPINEHFFRIDKPIIVLWIDTHCYLSELCRSFRVLHGDFLAEFLFSRASFKGSFNSSWR